MKEKVERKMKSKEIKSGDSDPIKKSKTRTLFNRGAREEFLREYLNNPSPVGYEKEFGSQDIWADRIQDINPSFHISFDSYGNTVAELNIGASIKVLVDAHADEIGFYVSSIDKSGKIKVGRLGGSDITITPSMRVNIRTGKGVIPGVFSHPAIHTHGGNHKPTWKNAYIDVGYTSKEEVQSQGIRVGDPITPMDEVMELGNYICGRGLDDKICGFITTELAKRFTKKDCDVHLILVNSVQEEIGLRGAAQIAAKYKPDYVIAMDVTHCESSIMGSTDNQTPVSDIQSGKGPVVFTCPSLHKKTTRDIKSTLDKVGIDYQEAALGGSSGTNADSYAYPHGFKTSLISLPLKYMHTTVEMVHQEDVFKTIDAVESVIRNIETGNI